MSEKQNNKKQVNEDSGVVEVKIVPYSCKPRIQAKRCFTPLGDRYMVKAELSIEDGKKIAKPGKKLDLYAYIQEQVASTDMASVIARVQAGDLDAINVNPNSFTGDATILPKDILDVHAMNRLYDNVSNSFAKLDPEIQALFDNSSEKFLNSLLDRSAEKLVSDYKANKAAAANGQEGE